MRQQNRKGNFNKHTNNAYGYGNPNEYEHYKVEKPAPLLEWLMENVKGPSKTKVKQTLQGRGIKVNGKTITQFDYALKPGMKVSVSKTKKNQEVFKSRYLKIVYEDRYLIVVEKNIGILSMAAGHSTLNVKTVLDDYFHKTRQNCQAHVVHRLDRETSGLMMYAKDEKTQNTLRDNWHDIVTDRRYVSIVSGDMEKEYGTVESWLTDRKLYVSSSPVDNGEGKFAVTHYKTIKRANGYSLVELDLETGRKNQIRVHMLDLGHPVVGDRRYGSECDPLGRLALHAFKLCFYHPVTKELMEFETPYPTAFKGLMQKK